MSPILHLYVRFCSAAIADTDSDTMYYYYLTLLNSNNIKNKK